MKDTGHVKNRNNINTQLWIACINKSKRWVSGLTADSFDAGVPLLKFAANG